MPVQLAGRDVVSMVFGCVFVFICLPRALNDYPSLPDDAVSSNSSLACTAKSETQLYIVQVAGLHQVRIVGLEFMLCCGPRRILQTIPGSRVVNQCR